MDADRELVTAGSIKRSLLREQAHRPEGASIVCVGDSMRPTVHVGDAVTIFARRRVRSGDVALFERGESEYLLHRIVFRLPATGWFVHVGDAGGRAAVAHIDQLVGRAALERRNPTVREYANALRLVARLARRRVLRRFAV